MNLINDKSDWSKVKLAIVSVEKSEKENFLDATQLTKGWYLCFHKQRCHKSQCISKYFFSRKHLSFKEELNNQFSNLIIAIKLSRAQVKDRWYSEAATGNSTGILSFLSKSLRNTCKRVHFLAMLENIGLQFY